MEHKLTVLSEALDALGDTNSAALVRLLAEPNIVRKAKWSNEFFGAHPEFMGKAEEFTKAKGIGLEQYLNYIDGLPEAMGLNVIHRDLGYPGVATSPPNKPVPQLPPRPVSTPVIEPEAELRWPFPPPEVLENMGAFIPAALAWAQGEGNVAYRAMYGDKDFAGREGEIRAARAYLRFLAKDVAPKLAATLQAKWREAPQQERETLRHWWKTFGVVWQLLQRMISNINVYEKQ